jgi:hypothetical protein
MTVDRRSVSFFSVLGDVLDDEGDDVDVDEEEEKEEEAHLGLDPPKATPTVDLWIGSETVISEMLQLFSRAGSPWLTNTSGSLRAFLKALGLEKMKTLKKMKVRCAIVRGYTL